ncbi:hypothetical protein H6P81_005522 [Aristolochia fimbriata]|uniref:Uncharacterized protein n=1 Tax=Aristolochia fimbriata TaxID=158543 RepID=A0AAV7EUV5_ARIFI|nr:hypothetical protein H6P81_005522 [Aristolochia fimbriata]
MLDPNPRTGFSHSAVYSPAEEGKGEPRRRRILFCPSFQVSPPPQVPLSFLSPKPPVPSTFQNISGQGKGDSPGITLEMY